jgi:hypothetical protein
LQAEHDLKELAEHDLKELADKLSERLSGATFQIWPADHGGTKYLKVHMQFTNGGASYPIMMVAIAERDAQANQAVVFAQDRTREQFTFPQQMTVFYSGGVAGQSQKIYMYYTDHQGSLVSQGTSYTLESLLQPEDMRDWVFQALLQNARARGLIQ